MYELSQYLAIVEINQLTKVEHGVDILNRIERVSRIR